MKGLPYSNSRGAAAAAPTPRRVRFDVKNVTVNVAATGDADAFGTAAVIGDLPEGNILLLGGCSYLQFTTADTDLTTTWTGLYSVGTAPMAADATLTLTEADLITSTVLGAATARTSPLTRGTKVPSAVLLMLDNTDGALEVNLNLVIDNTGISSGGAAAMTANGYVELVFIVLGDD